MSQETSSADLGSVRNLLNTFILLQSHLRLYGKNHANIAFASSRMIGFVDQLLAEDESYTIYVARHGFLLADGFIDRSSRNFERFANRLFQHGIATLTLWRGVYPGDIHTFLLLSARNPSETWDEGGMAACLRSRNIEKLTVREMTEQDFLLDDEPQVRDGEPLRQQRSALWERFALSILHGWHFEVPAGAQEQDISPSSLAAATNQQMLEHPATDKETFARDTSRFLLTLKHEKIRIYRTAATSKLADYVNLLSPDLRKLFLENAFNLNLDADLSEGLISGLSDQVILEALRNAALTKSYTPPVVLKLLGRLASERGIVPDVAMPTGEVDEDIATHRLKEIFKADDFDKYVPKPYQKTLLSIINSNGLPAETTEYLESLKTTIEPKAVDQHLGDILIEILRGVPDPKHAEGLRNNIIGTLDFYLATKNYRKLLEVYELCQNDGVAGKTRIDIQAHLATPHLTSMVLDDLSRLDSEKSGDAWALVFLLKTPFVGPLLDRLSTDTNHSTRLCHLKALVKIGSECIAEAIARLDDRRWFVIRNMLYLLREFGDPTVAPYVRRHLAHPHPKVSQEALRVCLSIKDPEAVPFLLRALATKDENELISAINLARFADDSRVVARLIELLHSGTLMTFHLEVRRAAVRSLAALAPRQALKNFEEILGTRSLMQARAHDALKVEIINALEKIPDGVTARLLQEQTLTGSAEVSRAAQMVLRRLTGASDGH